jgi:two-component system response regulator AtoC
MMLEDLRSTNGTRVHGVEVPPGQTVPVSVGSVIELGDATLLLERARLPPIVAPPEPRQDKAGPAAPIFADASMKRLYALLDIIGPTDLPVLILGETGVGKEVFAERTHAQSARRDNAFLRLNCAALPESVLEGELFGYEKGAFTGATRERPGLFESADRGTVFLDEVGELPLTTQAKLLRVLENGEVLRLGSRQPTTVDVRFISATNRDLRYLVASSAFRADLFFRLNGMSLTLPPLRRRKADILPLALRFLEMGARKLGRTPPALGPDAVEELERYSWPGNVRELRTVVERAVVFCTSGELSRKHLEEAAPEMFEVETEADEAQRVSQEGALPTLTPPPPTETVNGADAEVGDLRDTMRETERQRVLEALTRAPGKQTRAAEILGVSRRTLINKIEAHGIGRPRKSAR